MDGDGDVVAVIGGEPPVGRFDGAGSGFGLTACEGCGRIIDGVCSVCPTAPRAPTASAEDTLKRQDELREQSRRERAWYDRGAR